MALNLCYYFQEWEELHLPIYLGPTGIGITPGTWEKSFDEARLQIRQMDGSWDVNADFKI